MADELDKRLSDEESEGAFGSYKVAHREDGEEESYYEASHHLHGPVTSPPAGELIVPARCQQLLTVGLSHELQGKGEEKGRVRVRGQAQAHRQETSQVTRSVLNSCTLTPSGRSLGHSEDKAHLLKILYPRPSAVCLARHHRGQNTMAISQEAKIEPRINNIHRCTDS